MRNLTAFMLLSLSLFAGFFPQTVKTTISDVTKDSVKLKRALPVGMSGVIIHRYSDTLEAITGRLVQHSSTRVQLIKDDIIEHPALPTINTLPKVGDKVIGGYLYSNVLLLAPDAKSYTKITSSYQKNWVHPDLYALFLANEGESEPTKENLAKFAKTYQVGLIAIISQYHIKLLDPISGQIVAQKRINNLPKKGESPFYMRLEKIESGWFSKDTNNDYYTIMKRF